MDSLASFAEAEPDSLKWEFFRSVVLWQEMIYLDSAMVDAREVESRFMESLSAVIERGESILAKNPRDTVALFYTGFALGYLAKLDAAKGNEFKAASDGSKGLTYHKELLELCPDRYDAYFSLALFNYYTGFLPWYLRPLLFILGKSGSKEKAYEYLYLVREKGSLVRYEAEDILGEFYGREDKPDSVRIMYHRLISEFPDAALHYYDKLTWVLMDAQCYDQEALECRNAIRASEILHLTPADSMYLGKIYLRLASCYEKSGKLNEAILTCNEMIDRNITPPLSVSAHFALGGLYERANDFRNAAREYQWVVNAGSRPELVHRARERLDGLGIR